jgi:diguanylate cyclase (GGDEF)-like protein
LYAVNERAAPGARLGDWFGDWLVPAGVLAAAIPLPAYLLVGARLLEPVTQASTMVLMFLMVVVFRRIARLSGQPPANARFWASVAIALAGYGLGQALDLATVVSHHAFGTPNVQFGLEVAYPIAGLLTIVAMFQYPTTARTSGERITVGLEAGIVLLGSAAFVWYFSVSRSWVPEDGWLALCSVLIQPVLTLVTGFAMFKIAYVGAGVISRPTLTCFGVSVAIAAAGGLLPGGSHPLVTVTAVLSPLAGLLGGCFQYRISRTEPMPRRRVGARRGFGLLPYCASAAAFLLLAVVLSPRLDWRQWGVLGGVGLLLCGVSVRQFLALRDNRRLLADNRKLTAQLHRQAWYDELTGLGNRALYNRRIGQTLDRCRAGGQAALLLLDLDDFKSVNDTRGHAAGDALLGAVARTLVAHAPARDVVFRLGGDEFVVIAEGFGEADATELARRLETAIGQPVELGSEPVQAGVSIGIALADASSADPVALLRAADQAMYRAKSGGAQLFAH